MSATNNGPEEHQNIERAVHVSGGNFENFVVGDFHQHIQVQIIQEASHPKPELEEIPDASYDEFLKRVNLHLKNTLAIDNEPPSQPVLMLVDIESKDDYLMSSKAHEASNTKSFFGQDVKRIQLNGLHDEFNNKRPHHVMILGEAGAGKSTLSRQYAKQILNQNIESLKTRKCIVFVNAYDLLNTRETTAFDLFFTHQMAIDPDTKLNSPLQHAGSKWMGSNSNKAVIVIDGLDQSSIRICKERCPKLDSSTKTSSDVIVSNVIIGRIWPEALILTTSRWGVFWEFIPEYRPFKIVGLRGLDKENMQKASHYHCKGHRKKLIKFVEDLNSDSKLFSLCQNPLYLSYAAKILERQGQLPDTVSGLLASVFLYYFRCLHEHNSDIEKITNLAFHGMMENRFQFSLVYLRKFGIVPENAKGFLTTSVLLEDARFMPTAEDKKYVFTHQCMQEFNASLHIVNLHPQDVQKLISGALNEPRLEFMRQLCYGIIMNKDTFAIVENFLNDRQCSIKKCQEYFLSEFRNMLSDGKISDLKLVNLLHECGSDLMEKIKKDVCSINIPGDIPKNDQFPLVSIIKHCSPLEKVGVWWLRLDSEILPKLLQSYQKVKSFHIGYEIMDSLTSDHFEDIIKLLENTKPDAVSLYCADKLKDQFLLHWIANSKISFDYLGLHNACSISNLKLLFEFLSKYALRILGITLSSNVMASDISYITSGQIELLKVDYLKLVDENLKKERLFAYLTLMKAIGCGGIRFHKCNLTTAILVQFANDCRSLGIMINKLDIRDKFLVAEGFRELPAALSNCGQLNIAFSELNDEKLDELGKGFEKNDCSVKQIWIIDDFLDGSGYCHLALAISQSKCSALCLENCRLSKLKLSQLTKGCLEHGVKLIRLKICDDGLTPDGFCELPVCLGSCGCKELTLMRCNLSKNKVLRFIEGCKETGCVIDKMWICDDLIDGPGFCQLTKAIMPTKCSHLTLEKCKLNKAKLGGLGKGFRDNHAQIQQLWIYNTTLEERGFYQFALVIKHSKCPSLVFVDCQLNEAKLSQLRKGFHDHHVQLDTLFLSGEKFLPTDGLIDELCGLMQSAVKALETYQWAFNDHQTHKLMTTLTSRESKVEKLTIDEKKWTSKDTRN